MNYKYFITLAGFPTATQFDGISFVTTLEAPIVTLSPIVTQGKIVVQFHIKQFFHIIIDLHTISEKFHGVCDEVISVQSKPIEVPP